MQVKKQQLELDMEQQTGSRLGKEYIKAVYFHPAYLSYMQSTSCEMSRWCHPTTSSSIIPFPSCPLSFPAPASFPVSLLFTSGGQSIGVSASASVLPMNIQYWFPLGLTGLISLQSKGFSRVFFKASILWCSAFFMVKLSHPYMTPGKTIALTRQTFVGKETISHPTTCNVWIQTHSIQFPQNLLKTHVHLVYTFLCLGVLIKVCTKYFSVNYYYKKKKIESKNRNMRTFKIYIQQYTPIII